MVKVGDLVKVKQEDLGIIIKVLEDTRYKNGQMHLKVHLFGENNSAWFNVNALTLLSPKP